VVPGEAAGQPARISWQPDTRAFSFVNRTRTVEAGRAHTLDFDRVPGTDSIYAYGEIPLGTSPRTESFAVRDPAAWFIRVLGETLAQAGIALDPLAGQVTRTPPAGAAVLFEYRSPALPQLVGPVLQTSQNWFAEQLLRTLGKQVKREGSWQAGLAVEQEFLRDVVGIDTAAFRLRDGSGLSTGNLVAPGALVQLLRFMATSPGARTALEALPVSAAETGSLRNRLTDLPGRVRAKTGSVRNVASLAGLVRNESGRELAFCIIANGTGLPSSRVASAIDQVVRLLAGSRSGS
jgi:D-alanyl-D-alanine carboxypeptidase/D-alanyl-D-alanine-endopeptidase (penicillin-binding protein 4)